VLQLAAGVAESTPESAAPPSPNRQVEPELGCHGTTNICGCI